MRSASSKAAARTAAFLSLEEVDAHAGRAHPRPAARPRGDDPAPVRAERGVKNGAAVPAQDVDGLAGPRIPDPRIPVPLAVTTREPSATPRPRGRRPRGRRARRRPSSRDDGAVDRRARIERWLGAASGAGPQEVRLQLRSPGPHRPVAARRRDHVAGREHGRRDRVRVPRKTARGPPVSTFHVRAVQSRLAVSTSPRCPEDRAPDLVSVQGMMRERSPPVDSPGAGSAVAARGDERSGRRGLKATSNMRAPSAREVLTRRPEENQTIALPSAPAVAIVGRTG